MSKRQSRAQVPVHQTWDLEGLYPDHQTWAADVVALRATLVDHGRFAGRLGDSAEVLLACLQHRDEIRWRFDRIDYYASNRLAEDQGDPERVGLHEQARALAAQVESAVSFFRPELLGLSEEQIHAFLRESQGLRTYRKLLMDLIDERQHTLGAEAESVLAQVSELTQVPLSVYGSVVHADMRFDPVRDDDGSSVPVSLGSLSRLYQSSDRAVRKAAFESLNRGYLAHRNSLSAALAGAVKRDVMLAQLRRHRTSLDFYLAKDGLSEEVFTSFLETAELGSVHLRRYLELRRRKLGVCRLAPYDMGVPLDPDVATRFSFADAFALIIRAMATLGPEYLHLLERARDERWCDWAGNQGKSVVPFSRDCYGYRPAISLHWSGTLDDVFVLAHELGHALHSTLSQSAQPIVYGKYPAVLAETASTMNEVLLAQYLLSTQQESAVRRHLLTRVLNAFVTNYYFGAIAASFQLAIHEMAERGQPLTYESFTSTNMVVLKRFYGDALEISAEGLGAQWLRPPQHYMGYFSYQYAVGISAAAGCASAIQRTGEDAVARYLRFLRSGSSAPPAQLLSEAGIDPGAAATFEYPVALFASWVDELERLG